MPDHDSELHMPGIDDAIKRLESNLISQFEKHRMLQQCVKKKHQAVRLAQIDQATLICAEENDIVQSLGELEKARLTLTGTLTEMIRPDAGEPLTISEIAEFADEDRARRLRDIRVALNKLVMEIRKNSSVVRVAMEKLNQHSSRFPDRYIIDPDEGENRD